MMNEEIDPGDHHTREMYARYGLAMYFAQVVEAGIKNALVMAELADAQFTTIEDFDAASDTNFKTVLGRLIEKFKTVPGGRRAIRGRSPTRTHDPKPACASLLLGPRTGRDDMELS